MPLIKTESLNNHCIWGLWQITENLEDLLKFLNLPEEEKKLDRTTFLDKKKQKIAARLVIKHLLESWGHTFQGTLCDPSGKPMLAGFPYSISLSHSHSFAAAILRKKEKTGIDIELIKEKIVNIAPRVFSEEEIVQIKKDQEKLTILWAMKEVLYKMQGQKGLSFRENIHIRQVQGDSWDGVAQGIIRTEKGLEFFDLRYLRHQSYIIAYNT